MGPMRRHRPLALAMLATAGLITVVVGHVTAVPRTSEPSHALVEGQDGDPAAGAALFRTSCSTCHGPDGSGTDNGPSLVGVGAASADFQLRTGRMPFAGPRGTQPERKPPAFAPDEIEDLVAYVASLGDGPAIPPVRLDAELLSRGQALYVGNCAPCHGATANGGAVGGGSIAPPLDRATDVQVAEAVVVGPGQMPAFNFGEADRNAVVSYVDYLRSAPNPGGLSIGGIGPVPEGFVAWAVGMALLAAIVYLVGREWARAGGGGP